MDDLFGLGKSTDKLIGAVERALGAVYRSYGIRRDGDAEAYRLTALDRAKTEAKCESTVKLAHAKVEAAIITAEGKQELELRLQARLQHKALREQQNIEQVVAGAISQPKVSSNTENVDDDWLTDFFDRAKAVSGEEMQALWSKVLALEVGSPGTFSIRALDILRRLSPTEATTFQAACNLTASFSNEQRRSRIILGCYRDSWFRPSYTENIELSNFGVSFLDQLNLAKSGLLYEDVLVSGEIPKNKEIELHFASSKLKLRSTRSGITIANYSLTPIGIELSALAAADENLDYISTLRTSLTKLFDVSSA